MKILHVDTGKELRGGQGQLLLLARGLEKRGHAQTIVCPEGSKLEARAHEENLRVFALPSHDPGNAHGIFELREHLQAAGYDVLHAHDGRGQTLGWLASLGMAVRRVASRRVTYFSPRALGTRLKYGRLCHAVIAVSEHVRGILERAGVARSKIEVIPDGVEIPAALPDAARRAAVRARWGCVQQEFVVGHVGAFTHEKGQDIAIEALIELSKTLPQARLVLAGDGPLFNSARIREKGRRAGDRVRLLGYWEDLAEFFCGLDLFIMPSRSEGLGSSALLAMANGLAVVASRVGGLPEVVEDGKTGWLIPPDSPAALAEAIEQAASRPARLQELAANAREQARRFPSEAMVERTERLYLGIQEQAART